MKQTLIHHRIIFGERRRCSVWRCKRSLTWNVSTNLSRAGLSKGSDDDCRLETFSSVSGFFACPNQKINWRTACRVKNSPQSPSRAHWEDIRIVNFILYPTLCTVNYYGPVVHWTDLRFSSMDRLLPTRIMWRHICVGNTLTRIISPTDLFRSELLENWWEIFQVVIGMYI